MVKFTEEDKKWLEAHNAEKAYYYKRKELYTIRVNDYICINIESNAGSDVYSVSIITRYMSTVATCGENMILAIKAAIEEWQNRKKKINEFENTINVFEF